MKLSNLFSALPAGLVTQQSLPDPNLKIRQICLLTMNSSAFTADTLYIADTSTYLSLDCCHMPSLFLLIQDEAKISPEQLPSAYLLCAPIMDVDQVFTLSSALLHINEHVAESKLIISQALFDGVSISGLIDITANLLGNPILLQDATTRLLAHSRLNENFSPQNDEILSCVLSHGFVTADLFQKYDYANVLKLIEMSPQAYLLTSSKKSDRIICRLIVNRKYFGWICSIAHNHPFHDGDTEIIDFLSGALTILLERQNLLPTSSQAERLLLELLSAHSYSEESFKKRASGFSWILKDSYYLVVLTQDSTLADKTPRTIMAYKNHLSLLFPRMKSFLYDEKLILLFEASSSKSFEDTLIPFLIKSRLTGACSTHFTNILEFSDRYKQTASILEIGMQLRKKEPLLHFDDFWTYHTIRQLKQFYRLEYICMPELITIFHYDHQYGTSYAASIRIYLECGNLTAAAKKLHVHRNTLLYRIEKFSELTGLDLDKMQTKYHLWISYIILDLYPDMIKQ